MKFLPFVLLFVLDAVHADFFLLDEPEPDCEGYCNTPVKHYLSYIPSLQKRLEACKTLNPPYKHDKLVQINDQLAQQLNLTQIWQTGLDDKLAKLLEYYKQNLTAFQSKLKDMEEQLEKEIENVKSCESSARETKSLLSDQRNLVQKYKSERKTFERIGSKYYYIENYETQCWLSALRKCIQWGGHLACFQNRNEWENLKTKLMRGKRYWIDVNDIEEEGKYMSATTGESANFLNWERHEPNNCHRKQNCVEIRNDSFEMNDRQCCKKASFICESDTP